jgi:16S rRNA (guanine527-N7)-methyltransferase
MAEALLDVLARSRELGFLGPGPLEEQLAHAEAFVGAIDPAGVTEAVDLGSGGGVPGLVLAVALPHLRWVLVDGMVRRTSFLEEAVRVLGLEDRVEVRTARAEEAGRDTALRHRFGLVVARGFGPPAVTAECAAPLLAVGGQLVVSEPPGSTGDRWSRDGLAALGQEVDVVVPGPPAFVRVRQVALVDDRYPRRVGIPSKRPLWT